MKGPLLELDLTAVAGGGLVVTVIFPPFGGDDDTGGCNAISFYIPFSVRVIKSLFVINRCRSRNYESPSTLMLYGAPAMSIYKPYTYLIGWKDRNLFYYGVRYKQGCNPNDFWVDYFTSSKKVKTLIHDIGDPDIKEIRKTFNSPESAIIWEQKVLRRMNVIKKENWINANAAGAFKISPEMIKLRTENSKKTKQKNKQIPWNKGKKIGPSKLKGVCKSEETKAKMRKPKSEKQNMGRYNRTEETKKKISQHNIGSRYWTDGISCKRSKDCPGKGWVLGRKLHKKKYSKKQNPNNNWANGYFWWNDGSVNKRSKQSPGESWIRGYLNPRWTNLL